MAFKINNTSLTEVIVNKDNTETNLTKVYTRKNNTLTQVWGSRTFDVTVTNDSYIQNIAYEYIDLHSDSQEGSTTQTIQINDIGFDQDITLSITPVARTYQYDYSVNTSGGTYTPATSSVSVVGSREVNTYDLENCVFTNGEVIFYDTNDNEITSAAYGDTVKYDLIGDTGYDDGVSGQVTVDENNFTLDTTTLNATKNFGSAVRTTLNISLTDGTYGSWDVSSLDVKYGDTIVANSSTLNIYKWDEPQVLRTSATYSLPEDTESYHYQAEYTGIVSPIINNLTISAEAIRTCKVSIDAGDGISSVYTSTNPNATTGSSTDAYYPTNSTVYAFAVLGEGYSARSTWVLIQGTGNTPGAIYRVNSVLVDTAKDFGTISALINSYAVTITAGTGLQDAYWSINADGSNGSESGELTYYHNTVYGFVVLDAGYEAQSGWVLVDGTAKTEGAVYRVDSALVGVSGVNFGTFNAVAQQYTLTVICQSYPITGPQTTGNLTTDTTHTITVTFNQAYTDSYTKTGYDSDSVSGTWNVPYDDTKYLTISPIQYSITQSTINNATYTLDYLWGYYNTTITQTVTPAEHYDYTISGERYYHTKPYTRTLTVSVSNNNFNSITLNAITYTYKVTCSNSDYCYYGGEVPSSGDTSVVTSKYASRSATTVYYKINPKVHYYFDSLSYIHDTPYVRSQGITGDYFTFNDATQEAVLPLGCSEITYSFVVTSADSDYCYYGATPPSSSSTTTVTSTFANASSKIIYYKINPKERFYYNTSDYYYNHPYSSSAKGDTFVFNDSTQQATLARNCIAITYTYQVSSSNSSYCYYGASAPVDSNTTAVTSTYSQRAAKTVYFKINPAAHYYCNSTDNYHDVPYASSVTGNYFTFDDSTWRATYSKNCVAITFTYVINSANASSCDYTSVTGLYSNRSSVNIDVTITPNARYYCDSKGYTSSNPYSATINGASFSFDDSTGIASYTKNCVEITYTYQVSSANSAYCYYGATAPSTGNTEAVTSTYANRALTTVHYKINPAVHYYVNSNAYYNGNPYSSSVNGASFSFNDATWIASYSKDSYEVVYTFVMASANSNSCKYGADTNYNTDVTGTYAQRSSKTLYYQIEPAQYYYIGNYYYKGNPLSSSISGGNSGFVFNDATGAATYTYNCSEITYTYVVTGSNSSYCYYGSTAPSSANTTAVTGTYAQRSSKTVYYKINAAEHYYYSSTSYYHGVPYSSSVGGASFTFNDSNKTATYSLSCTAITYTLVVTSSNSASCTYDSVTSTWSARSGVTVNYTINPAARYEIVVGSTRYYNGKTYSSSANGGAFSSYDDSVRKAYYSFNCSAITYSYSISSANSAYCYYGATAPSSGSTTTVTSTYADRSSKTVYYKINPNQYYYHGSYYYNGSPHSSSVNGASFTFTDSNKTATYATDCSAITYTYAVYSTNSSQCQTGTNTNYTTQPTSTYSARASVTAYYRIEPAARFYIGSVKHGSWYSNSVTGNYFTFRDSDKLAYYYHNCSAITYSISPTSVWGGSVSWSPSSGTAATLSSSGSTYTVSASTGFTRPSTYTAKVTSFSYNDSSAVATSNTTPANCSVNAYTLSVSASNCNWSVYRSSSPYAGASAGYLSNGSTIYYGDVLDRSSSGYGTSYGSWSFDSVQAPYADDISTRDGAAIYVRNPNSFSITIYDQNWVQKSATQYNASWYSNYYYIGYATRSRSWSNSTASSSNPSGSQTVTGNVSLTFSGTINSGTETEELNSGWGPTLYTGNKIYLSLTNLNGTDYFYKYSSSAQTVGFTFYSSWGAASSSYTYSFSCTANYGGSIQSTTVSSGYEYYVVLTVPAGCRDAITITATLTRASVGCSACTTSTSSCTSACTSNARTSKCDNATCTKSIGMFG